MKLSRRTNGINLGSDVVGRYTAYTGRFWFWALEEFGGSLSS
jgi:hypothetical protein